MQCRHRITGWSIYRSLTTKDMIYEIKFERLSTETSMDLVLRRPFADEIEDYKEYKRLRQLHREQVFEVGNSRSEAMGQVQELGKDGTEDLKVATKSSVAVELLSQEKPQSAEGSVHAEMLRHKQDFRRSDSTVA